MSKMFKLGEVLSVAGNSLMCEMSGVYRILNYMTGDNLFTHQLPRAVKECKPYILKQHPGLKKYVDELDPTVTTKNWKKVLSKCYDIYGLVLSVEPIPMDDHTKKEPIQELIDMVGKDKVIIVGKE